MALFHILQSKVVIHDRGISHYSGISVTKGVGNPIFKDLKGTSYGANETEDCGVQFISST